MDFQLSEMKSYVIWSLENGFKILMIIVQPCSQNDSLERK
jgi:hypothetical protein